MNTNFYDFIEIGTSDFDTLIQQETNKNGLSIEPIKYYLNRLPNKENVKKINIAISDKNGECNVYYIPSEEIHKYGFPEWVRGCNSINSYHKTVVNECLIRNINPNSVIKYDTIPVKTLITLLKEYNVNGIYTLKIDTEGHDCVILKKFYEELDDNKYLPHNIIFESNVLTNSIDVDNIIQLFQIKGYDLVSRNHDTTLILNLNKIKNKTKFMDGIKNYYIHDYPLGYNNYNPPHENTLDSAKKYCMENNYSGVTYQNGRYEIRNGKYMSYNDEYKDLTSWVYL